MTWIKARLEHLAACFAVEVCAYAVMSNTCTWFCGLGQTGAIPVHLSPILLRLNVDESRRLKAVQGFGSMFHRVAGRMESMIAAARRAGLRRLRGFRTGGKAFSST